MYFEDVRYIVFDNKILLNSCVYLPVGDKLDFHFGRTGFSLITTHHQVTFYLLLVYQMMFPHVF